ncbi:hypothetical protein R9C00_12735 [Flammeovirgaceae bacterium SG7u.111]|nr:hypothetical protein [Flammeovirgaceae bacterium SG7u.132]WPO38320.1 hypothetical protein R9C00_12735 [Flammeovirgaceae bacterium SG7u.111]
MNKSLIKIFYFLLSVGSYSCITEYDCGEGGKGPGEPTSDLPEIIYSTRPYGTPNSGWLLGDAYIFSATKQGDVSDVNLMYDVSYSPYTTDIALSPEGKVYWSEPNYKDDEKTYHHSFVEGDVASSPYKKNVFSYENPEMFEVKELTYHLGNIYFAGSTSSGGAIILRGNISTRQVDTLYQRTSTDKVEIGGIKFMNNTIYWVEYDKGSNSMRLLEGDFTSSKIVHEHAGINPTSFAIDTKRGKVYVVNNISYIPDPENSEDELYVGNLDGSGDLTKVDFDAPMVDMVDIEVDAYGKYLYWMDRSLDFEEKSVLLRVPLSEFPDNSNVEKLYEMEACYSFELVSEEW